MNTKVGTNQASQTNTKKNWSLSRSTSQTVIRSVATTGQLLLGTNTSAKVYWCICLACYNESIFKDRLLGLLG
jgi:hypothetical protein